MKILTWALLITVIVCVPSMVMAIGFFGGGGGSSLTMVEGDASPSVSGVTSITVPNGSLTDNGSGSVTFTPAGTGDVSAAATFGTDNVIIRSDGTSKGVQSTGISVSDTTNDITGAGSIGFGSNPGDAGRVRLSNGSGEGLCFEVATPGTDKCLTLNTSDQLDFNGTLNLSGATTGSVVLNGSTSGSLTVTTAAATAQAITVTGAAQTVGATTLTIPDMANTNDTFMFNTLAATLLNKTLNTESTGNLLTIPKRVWLPAAGCNNATAGSVWDLPTSNAPAAACITGTNTQKGVLDFDQTTDESAQVTLLLPSTWTGAIDANVLWLSATTTGSVAWCIQLISSADAETDDPAFPVQAVGNCVSDAAKGTTNQLNVAALTGITATGVAAGELLHIQISRDPNETSTRTDDHAADARLVGVELIYRVAE